VEYSTATNMRFGLEDWLKFRFESLPERVRFLLLTDQGEMTSALDMWTTEYYRIRQMSKSSRPAMC
jgi:hypothetical protein